MRTKLKKNEMPEIFEAFTIYFTSSNEELGIQIWQTAQRIILGNEQD